METTTPLQDQLANISPVWVVAAVAAITLLRILLAKNKEAWARTISETCDTINFVLILAFLLIKPFVAQAFYIPSESMQNTLLVGDRLIVNKFGYRFAAPQSGDVVVFQAWPQATGGQDQDFIKRLIGRPGQTIQIKPPHLVLNKQEVDVHGSGDATDLHSYLRSRLGLQDGDALKIEKDDLLINGTEKMTKERLAELLGQPGASVELTPGTVYVDGKPLDEPYTREDPDYTNYSFEGGENPKKLSDNEVWVMGDNRNHSADSHYYGPLEKHRLIGRAMFLFFPFNRWGRI